MAAAFAEAAVDGGLVGVQQVNGHKRLNGAGKAAALQTPRAAAIQHALAQGQGHRHALLLRVLDAVGVLVELKAGVTALDNQAQESFKIVLAHGVAELGGAAAVVVEVHRTHDGAVPHGLAQLGQSLVELVLIDLAQDLFAELLGHALHLTADGGIVVGQVGVAALRVADAHDKAVLRQVNGRLADHRVGRVLEVDGDNAADGAGGLVHQTAGLAKEHVFGKLADLGDLDLVELLHVIVVVLAAQDGTDADLKGCGAGQTGAAQHVAGGVAVKAAHLAARIHDALGYAADQGRGVLGLARLRDEVGDIDIVNFVKAQGLDADDIFLIRGDDGHHIQVDRAGQHHAVVVVGVIAADLGAARGGIEAHRAVGAVFLFKFVDQVGIALALLLHGVCTVQLGKGGVVFALCDLLFEFNGICHDSTHLSCRAALFVDMHKLSLMFLGRQPKERLSAGFLFSV